MFTIYANFWNLKANKYYGTRENRFTYAKIFSITKYVYKNERQTKHERVEM